ncbi:MAG: sugar nucleotide-binding protein [Myxococcota bacterium]
MESVDPVGAPGLRTALVVGGDGRVGRALAADLEARGWRVWRTSRRPAPPDGTRFLDLAAVAREGAVALPDCDVGIVCAALSSYPACAEDLAVTEAVNVVGPGVICRALREAGAGTIFVSTNAVFDGETPRRKADDPTGAPTPYGRSKQHAERHLAALDPELAVLRLTKVLAPDDALFAGWIRSLAAGEEIEAFDDMVAAPVALAHVTQALCRMCEDGVSGIRQLSAEREMSYLEMARHVAARVGVDPARVRGVSAAERGIAPGAAPRHSSLDASDFLPGFGLDPIDPAEVLDSLVDALQARGH